MDERYRRLHYDPAVMGNPYWSQSSSKQAMSGGRIKKQISAIPKKKNKDTSAKPSLFDVPNYHKQYRDKYGSVSAHSTSAIYGALRAPHCHAMYSTSDMWYASVRSLNSRPRDIVYPPDAYDWREPVFEEIQREGCSVSSREMIRRAPCACVVRRRPAPSSRFPRCKYCSSSPVTAASLNTVPLPSKRSSLLSEKAKLNSVSEEKDDSKPELVDRMSCYKKNVTGSASKSKTSRFSKDSSTKEAIKPSRKSILECDVTAYDLIKKIPTSPSISEVDESDLDDMCKTSNGKQKIRLRKNQNKQKSASSKIENLLHRSQKSSQTARVLKSRNENSIYSESSSVLLGGRRIFTTYQSPRSPDLFEDQGIETSNLSVNGDTSVSRWRKPSISDESVCIPEPDYDCSENSDDSDSCLSKFKDLKLTYSPPLLRKLSNDSSSNLNTSREISKSMSSLHSQETLVPSISINRSYTSSPSIRTNGEIEFEKLDNEITDHSESEIYGDRDNYILQNFSDEEIGTESIQIPTKNCSINNMKYESFSSSDCSSNGGTLSSDYPTWTSSSSSELKSILKKKKKRESSVQGKNTVDVFSDSESKDSQRKKQVQFRASIENTVIGESQKTENSLQTVNGISDYSEIGEQSNAKEAFSTVIPASDKVWSNSFAPVIDSHENVYETLNKSSDPINPDTHNVSSLDERLSHFKSDNESVCEGFCSDAKESHTFLHRSNSKSRITDNAELLSQKLNSHNNEAICIEENNLIFKLPARSSSMEDIRESEEFGRRKKKHIVAEGDEDKKDAKRKRRSTLPKRRFSDLHLHLLLCPTRSSLCGDGSSSDDIPLTTAKHRAHRSLPDSPSELEENVEPFRFDLVRKISKDEEVSPTSRSTFYIPVAGPSQSDDSQKNSSPPCISSLENNDHQASSSSGNSIQSPEDESLDEPTSPLQDDTDEDNLENEYENLDPIYEELSDVSNASKRIAVLDTEQKSFFEGASKTDILSYLEDAKERGISEGLSEDESKIIPEEDEEEEEDEGKINRELETEKDRVIVNNSINKQDVIIEVDETAENSSEDIVTKTLSVETDKSNKSSSAEIERNDSGVGTETSKPSRISKVLPADNEEQLCADCDHQVEPVEDEISGLLYNPLVCRKCDLRRCERKEIIIEFVDTELKYGRDLRIIKEEFYRPMEIAGLLIKDHLLCVFLNLEELISFNMKFSEKLQDALDIAMEQGDEDYTTVNIGKIFLETSSMLHAFETYCVKQASASVLLSNLEKEKELLRIFLRVSQMENTLLRRMNLPAFLMVPVQRVTRYPLLLCRLHKVTPIHHKDRNALKEAQQKVELHLEHINQQTKGVGGTKIWRRISNISASHRRLGTLQDIGSIKLRKMALELLKWKQDEVRFVMAGKLLFTQVTDYPWNKKGKTLKFTPLHALLVALGKPNSNYRPESVATENPVLFPRNTGIRDASLVLMKEKNGRYVMVREPLYLGTCVISCDSETDSDVFEVQEYTTKEAYLLKGETMKDSKEWLRLLRYHAKDLGSWRRRRNALANIMINGMIRP